MQAMRTPPTPAEVAAIDERVILHDVPWEQYASLLQTRGERSVPRMTYLRGELELMTPSRYHELMKKRLARLLEVWAEEMGLTLEGFGSWTLTEEAEKVGLEPDECYVVGPRDWDAVAVPDIALEVVWTSGGLSKLEVYRHLGVREVWIWRQGRLTFHALRGERYEEVPRSEVLPALAPAFLLQFLDAPDQTTAVRELRRALREKRPSS